MASQDLHACGAAQHVYPCPPNCQKAKRTAGRKHLCRTANDGKRPAFCAPGCTRHAKARPDRIGGVKFERPKGKRKHAVPIPRQPMPSLRAHFAAQEAESKAAGVTWHDWDLVWCQPNGQPIDANDDYAVWKSLLAEAGISKDTRVHDARHTCGTLVGEQHVDMHVIQRILGHAQVTTTRIYTDPTDPLTREAVDAMG